ncbi:hypothetical protein [Streptomyces turgidiscabies]|uniref:hypothetical protein n=1 Tax=Streptomyces turgidiscabies TaxID=85558 RepID=UPI0038F6BF1E
MSQPPPVRKPYDHTLHLINSTNKSINAVTGWPDGRSRDLDGPTAAGTLVASSNLAIASALLAVADAIRGGQ